MTAAAPGPEAANPYLMAAQGIGQVAGAGLTAWLSEMQQRRAIREQRKQAQAQMDEAARQQRLQLETQKQLQADQLKANAPSQTMDVLSKIAGLQNNNMDWRDKLTMMVG